jgi:hypothetical protein
MFSYRDRLQNEKSVTGRLKDSSQGIEGTAISFPDRRIAAPRGSGNLGV